MMRTSILAGSVVDNGTFNGESQAHVRGEDFTFESGAKKKNSSID